jgi:hypothetical protein
LLCWHAVLRCVEACRGYVVYAGACTCSGVNAGLTVYSTAGDAEQSLGASPVPLQDVYDRLRGVKNALRKLLGKRVGHPS